MSDIRTVQKPSLEAVTMDWLLADGVLDETQELATSVAIALGTDRRAQDGDRLPDPRDDDRRGWWGDMDAESIWGGWPVGSRLWLLAREKITGPEARQGSTVGRVETYGTEAMQPFVRAGIASRATVQAERIGLGRIDLTVTLYRGPLSDVQLTYQDVWLELSGGA